MAVDLDQEDLEAVARLGRREVVLGDVDGAPFVARAGVGEPEGRVAAVLEARQHLVGERALERLDALLLRLVGAGDVQGADDGGVQLVQDELELAARVGEGQLGSEKRVESFHGCA